MVERSKCMNVPEIRFKEFCDYYSDILLEKCLSVSNKKNNKLEYKKEDALSVSDEFGVVNQIEHLGRSYTGYNISTYKILNKGQIVYTKSPLKLKPFGIIKVNKNKPGIVSVLYAIYDVKEGFDPNYISVYFEPNFRLNKYLLPLINKGAKNTINISDEPCVDCNDPVECIEVEDASGTAKGTYSKLEDAAAAAGNGDILKLLYNCESTSTYIDAGNKNLTIDLNKKELKAVYFDIMGSLVIENGEYSGYIRNAATGNEHTLTFENVRADLTQLGWYAKGGIKLVNSNIEQQHDGAAFTEWWLEKLQMDQTSVYKITNSPSGLSNYGLLSLDEAVGGIEEFLPAGYTLDGQPNSYNTILDETGTKARSVELRYRRRFFLQKKYPQNLQSKKLLFALGAIAVRKALRTAGALKK